MDNLVSVAFAAKSTGKHSRTLRYWISNGKLPATRGKRGMLVNLSDVQRIAMMTRNEHGNGNGTSISTDDHSPHLAEIHSLSPSIVSHMENPASMIIREAIAPFIIELKTAHEEIGNLRARLEAERERREIAENALLSSRRADNNVSSASDTNELQRTVETVPEGLWEKLRRVFFARPK